MPDETMEVLTREGKPWRVNKAKFEDMAKALMAVLPAEAPGMTVAEAKEALSPLLDAAAFGLKTAKHDLVRAALDRMPPGPPAAKRSPMPATGNWRASRTKPISTRYGNRNGSRPHLPRFATPGFRARRIRAITISISGSVNGASPRTACTPGTTALRRCWATA